MLNLMFCNIDFEFFGLSVALLIGKMNTFAWFAMRSFVPQEDNSVIPELNNET